MTTTNTATARTQRRSTKITECTIIAIYKFKTNLQLNGTRCTLLRNGGGKEHKVWTHSNGCASHCDCDGFEKSHGRRKCYHIKHVEALEAAKRVVVIPEVVEEAAKPTISDEQMAAIAAEAHRVVDETPAITEPAEDARDLVAVAQSQAARASDAVDALIASAVASARREAAPLNGSRGIAIARTATPVLAAGRVVPMRR